MLFYAKEDKALGPALLPLIVEPAELKRNLAAENLLIVDLFRPQTYTQVHVPGAVHLDYVKIIAARPPATGLLPDAAALSAALGSVGIKPDSHVVAYDDEGGGRASRLLWTLDAVGHSAYSLLNGGLHAWLNDRLPVSSEPAAATASLYPVKFNNAVVADKNYIMDRLRDAGTVIVDTRTPAEDLKRMLTDLGVTPDKEIVTYCQTHHRSAHTYMVLKSLGYPQLRGYAGSWSEWGNSRETPIE